MANPVPGTTVPKFNRFYIVVNPNALEGPPTYRVSNQDQIGSGGGSGGGAEYVFEGETPIVVDTLYSNTSDKNVVRTSMDIQDLDNRVY